MRVRPASLLAALALLSVNACGDDSGPVGPAATVTTTADAVASPSTAMPGARSCAPIVTAIGAHERVDVADGPRDGWYLRYVPSRTSTEPPALVVDLHGYPEHADFHAGLDDLASVAEREGFVLVTPQGNGSLPFWNYQQHDDGPPDVAFLAAVVDDVERDLCTDSRRVFVTGLSNGAFMASTLACELAERIAAVAPVAGIRFEDGCAPSRPVPVIAFHGTADEFVTYDASPSGSSALSLPTDPASVANFAGHRPQPVEGAAEAWAHADGCDGPPAEEALASDVTLLRWGGCDAGADVELVRVEGGGHTWPGSERSVGLEAFLGPTTMSIEANDLMWAFFEDHPLP
jgi:polyhydroxybutyrate depolymerase